MLDRDATQTDLPVGSNIASIAVKIAIIVYEKFTGNAYTTEEIYLLGELRRIYEETLQASAPVYLKFKISCLNKISMK